MAREEGKRGQFAQKVEETLGIIPGTKLWTPFPFAGLNLQDTAPAIDDKEFTYLENFFRLGNGYLRTAWDVSRFYTQNTGTIISFFWYNIGTIDYVALFFADGTAIQIQQSNGVIKPITTTPNTFYVPGGTPPACSQSGTQYLLISNNNTPNDYWIWDGSLLYQSGSLAPGLLTVVNNGSNYTSIPTLTTYGGSGSGAQYKVTLQSGGVLQVEVTNPGSGFQIGDIPQVAFEGGGSDNSAILEAVLNSGSVTATTISNPGSGYTTATVAFTGGGGSGATGTVDIGSGVDTLTITAPGTGYTGASVLITGGGGSGATATATVLGGQVTDLTITDSGSAYTSAPTVTISGDGTGALATATIQNGIVTGIEITSGGNGYTSPPTVTITGDGTGATASALLSSSGINSVNVVDPGTGFLYAPNISFIGGGGHGAAGDVVLVGTSIARIDVLAGGANYNDVPDVVISGGGRPTGSPPAQATAILSGGQVTAVTVQNGRDGFIHNPLVSFVVANGKTGSGAAAQAIFKPTSIASVTMTARGFDYTSAPAVVIDPGANNAAAVAPLNLMPFGANGNAIETFNSRVWLTHQFQKFDLPTGGNFIVSVGESLTDFATSDGGVLFTTTDRFLRKQYNGLRQSNGYLYFFGDSSTSVVSNIQTQGNPITTTFTYQNVDPQVGMAWRDSVQDFGRTIVFANQTGIYALYGGQVSKISGKLDQLFDVAIFPPDSRAITPVSACATIHNVKHYFLLFTIHDPELGVPRNVMATWNEQTWTITSQTVPLTYIGTQEVNSQLFAWGTDGTSLYELFAQPSGALLKRLSTKMYGADSLFILKDFLNLYLQAQDLSAELAGVNFAVDMVSSGAAIQNPKSPSVANSLYTEVQFPDLLFPPVAFTAPPPFFPVFGAGTGGFSFDSVMVRMQTLSPDFALSHLMVAYQDNTAYQ
jgi:hypothetical protein